MSRLSIGRLIAIAMAVTIVLLFSIDTTVACRYLWRSHHRSCAPVYCCPTPCQVITYSNCGSAVPTTSVPAYVQELAPQEAAPLPEPVEATPDDSLGKGQSVIDSPSDETGITDVSPPDAGDDAFDAPADDPSADLIDEPEIVEDLPDVDATTDEADVFDLPGDDTDDLPTDDAADDLPADDTATDFLPDDTEDPLGEILSDPEDGTDTLPDTDDGSLDDVFPTDDTEPTDGGNGDDLMRDLFEPGDDADAPADPTAPADDTTAEEDLFEGLEADLDSDLETDTDTDLLPTDDADDLFPMDDDTSDADSGTSSGTTDDDLNDLFSGLPEKETIGFHEVDLPTSEVATEGPTTDDVAEQVVEANTDDVDAVNVAPQDVTRHVEQIKPAERVWTDNTGIYTTVGRLVKIGETHVRLMKNNGRFSTVSKQRLSHADLEYVREMVKYLGVEELDYVASR